ncbi:MAG: hypothetical protein AAB961_00445, partial [Patescibacteria group bacterium]
GTSAGSGIGVGVGVSVGVGDVPTVLSGTELRPTPSSITPKDKKRTTTIGNTFIWFILPLCSNCTKLH